MKNQTMSFLATALVSSLALATPAQVVIIRHAEKPPQGSEVSQQGCERAYLLPSFFQHNSIVNAFGNPVAIFAMAPSNADGTLRPIQTIAPTALAMNMQSNAQYDKKEGNTFANMVLNNPAYNGRTVWVSWEHTAIPALAASFGVPAGQIPSTPWPEDVFDQAWIVTYSSASQSAMVVRHHRGSGNGGGSLVGGPALDAGTSVSLQIIPEYILPTDNPQGGNNWSAGPQTPTSSSPVVPAVVQAECVNNISLNDIARQVTVPANVLQDFPLNGN